MTIPPNQPPVPPEADREFVPPAPDAGPPAAAAAPDVPSVPDAPAVPVAATRREAAAAAASAAPPEAPDADADADEDANAVALTPPAPVSPPGVPASATAREPRASDPAVDLPEPGTYDRLVEPRSDARLTIEPGVWHQVSRKYVTEQFITSGLFLVLVVAVTLVLTLVLDQAWAWIPGGVVIVLLVWALAITPRQSRAIGYRLREDDLVFRRGILWQRIVAVPYGRMQLVDISHGPLDRGFKLAQLKLVTAAAATGVTIPGLPQETAEALRDQLIAVAESRRTGL